jgi:hypothetical protein
MGGKKEREKKRRKRQRGTEEESGVPKVTGPEGRKGQRRQLPTQDLTQLGEGAKGDVSDQQVQETLRFLKDQSAAHIRRSARRR